MSDLIPIVGALISIVCAIYLAIAKHRDDRFEKLSDQVVEHSVKISAHDIRLETLESIREEMREMRAKLDKITETMVTKSDFDKRGMGRLV